MICPYDGHAPPEAAGVGHEGARALDERDAHLSGVDGVGMRGVARYVWGHKGSVDVTSDISNAAATSVYS